jgi:hypothetical protein
MDGVSFPINVQLESITHIIEQLIELLSEVAERINAQEKDISRFSVSREVDARTKEPTNTLVLIET